MGCFLATSVASTPVTRVSVRPVALFTTLVNPFRTPHSGSQLFQLDIDSPSLRQPAAVHLPPDRRVLTRELAELTPLFFVESEDGGKQFRQYRSFDGRNAETCEEDC
jgi:hypothetical protein